MFCIFTFLHFTPFHWQQLFLITVWSSNQHSGMPLYTHVVHIVSFSFFRLMFKLLTLWNYNMRLWRREIAFWPACPVLPAARAVLRKAVKTLVCVSCLFNAQEGLKLFCFRLMMWIIQLITGLSFYHPTTLTAQTYSM